MKPNKNGPVRESGRPPSLLDELVREARENPIPAPIDWEKVDTALFSKVEREAEYRRALATQKGQPWPWLVLGGLAAAAAAAMVMMRPAGDSRSPVATVESVGVSGVSGASGVNVEGSAGDLAFQSGAGEVRVDGTRAQAGMVARQGQVIETRGAKAVFEASRRISWLVEDESKVQVERAGSAGTSGGDSPVVLALSHGAIEAQVAPVLSGEAFAVDVGGARVAVHGTHLRVAREGDHVVVDLTEGVVSIGTPPKVGSTYGTLVTAPAHVEFQASAPRASLVVEHDASAIRGAVDIMNPASEESSIAPVAPVAMLAPAPSLAARVEAPASPNRSSRRPARSAPARTAEESIVEAVNACWAKYAPPPPHSSDPDATYTTTAVFATVLTFNVNADGLIDNTAKFQQSVPTQVHDCATAVLFDKKTRFAPGSHEIPIVIQQ